MAWSWAKDVRCGVRHLNIAMLQMQNDNLIDLQR